MFSNHDKLYAIGLSQGGRVRIKLAVILGASLLIVGAFFYIGLNANNNLLQDNETVMNQNDLKMHPHTSGTIGSFIITGDDDWTNHGGIVTGTGTWGDPYVIANHTIDCGSSDGIKINNTQAPFRIVNCTFINIGVWNSGIHLNNTGNGSLSGNTLVGNGYVGFYLVAGSENNTIVNNTCTHIGIGIWLQEASNNNTLVENTCTEGTSGIRLFSSGNNTLSGNNCTQNYQYGIFISGSNNNTLSGNNCTGTTQDGICLDAGSSGNEIINNTCSKNGLAISIAGGCKYNLIRYNWIKKNSANVINNLGADNTIEFNFFSTWANVYFTSNTTTIVPGDSVSFTDATTGGTMPLSYRWDFRDNTAYSTDQNPTHTFTTAGTYNVTLSVTDGDDDSLVYHINITVIQSVGSAAALGIILLVGASAVIGVGVINRKKYIF